MDYSILVAKTNTLEDLLDGPRSTELTVQVNNFQKVPFIHYSIEKFDRFFKQQYFYVRWDIETGGSMGSDY